MATLLPQQIIDFLYQHPGSSSKEIYNALAKSVSYATVKRALNKLLDDHYVSREGKGRATIYSISTTNVLLHPIDMVQYFQKEIDERVINDSFNFNLLCNILPATPLFTSSENNFLNRLQQQFQTNVQQLSPEMYSREMERLAIDLSWKSSQIEGNAYSLLETERLLTEKETAAGKSKDDATMLLNHKEAIDFVLEHPDYITPLTVRSIEDIHFILIKDLHVDRNIRTRRVGISGTNYRPLDNIHQIHEAMEAMCTVINSRQNIFEKALLCLLLTSYIQPFNDGNKRSGRIISNAILLANDHCPLSFRTVDAIDYKKAILIFYEQNNVSAFKQIFIEQYEFAVQTYF